MVKSHAAPHATPPSLRDGDSSDPQATSHSSAAGQFFSMALTMSWQLALVVLIPVIAGVQLDKASDTSFIFTFVGLAIALIGTGVVMWRTLQTANRVPVPKVSAAERRAIKKSYEEDDE